MASKSLAFGILSILVLAAISLLLYFAVLDPAASYTPYIYGGGIVVVLFALTVALMTRKGMGTSGA